MKTPIEILQDLHRNNCKQWREARGMLSHYKEHYADNQEAIVKLNQRIADLAKQNRELVDAVTCLRNHNH